MRGSANSAPVAPAPALQTAAELAATHLPGTGRAVRERSTAIALRSWRGSPRPGPATAHARKEIRLRRWRNAEDPLFHPRTPVDGNGLLTALEIEPGPRLGRLLHHLKLEHAFGRIQTPKEALKEAQHFLTRESEAL